MMRKVAKRTKRGRGIRSNTAKTHREAKTPRVGSGQDASASPESAQIGIRTANLLEPNRCAAVIIDTSETTRVAQVQIAGGVLEHLRSDRSNPTTRRCA